MEKAATDLYSDTEKNAASTAFQMVGIGGGGGTTDYETDVEMNPGEDFLLHSDGSLSNLYIRDNNLNLIADPLSNVDHISKPSVTDNGEIIFFVGSDNNIYVITIDWQSGNAGINTFDDQGVWRNVAISKDGRRLAAITNQISNSIIVVDFEIQNQKTFELYNPTYTEGVSSGNVDYSDAMEFDFTGEWLIYDAQSTINGASGDIVYWDIGFLNVFDNNSNTFAEGKVEKLFNQLPVNTSVGNPTFSKNSPYIIAFDLIEGSTYKIMGANIEQNKVSEIFENGNLGYPSFNNADNQLVYEWNWLFGTDIGLSSLESDKITSVFGSETVIVEDSKRPVVFSNGERTIVGDKETEIVMDFTIYPNPTSDYIRVELTDNNEIERIDIYDATGRSVFSKQEVDGNQVIDVREWNGGIYSVQITSKKGDNKLKTFVKI